MHKVDIFPRPTKDGEIFEQLDIEDAIRAAWTCDPGYGRAVLLKDGREVLNPLPMAPPVGYVAEPSLFERMEQMLSAKLAMLRDDEEIDSEADWQDFEVADDIEPDSPYTVVMHDEFPAVPPGHDQPVPGEVGDAPDPGVRVEPSADPVDPPAKPPRSKVPAPKQPAGD